MNEHAANFAAFILTAAIILGLAFATVRIVACKVWATMGTGDRVGYVLWAAYFLAFPIEAALVYIGWRLFVGAVDLVTGCDEA